MDWGTFIATSLLALIERLATWLNFLLDYIEENSAAFICAYITILVEALWKKYGRERKAKQSYLSLFGTLIEHNTIPDKEGLASLKRHFPNTLIPNHPHFP